LSVTCHLSPVTFPEYEIYFAGLLICCVMAASPSPLGEQVPDCSTSILPLGSINSSENILQTTIDMEKLLVPTAVVEISYNCHNFDYEDFVDRISLWTR
jgi:hypothetical protein